MIHGENMNNSDKTKLIIINIFLSLVLFAASVFTSKNYLINSIMAYSLIALCLLTILWIYYDNQANISNKRRKGYGYWSI